jgi:hypothetical protein
MRCSIQVQHVDSMVGGGQLQHDGDAQALTWARYVQLYDPWSNSHRSSTRVTGSCGGFSGSYHP